MFTFQAPLLSSFRAPSTVLTLIASIACAGLILTATRLRSKGWAVALGFVLGGAFGNLLDRFLAPPGGGNGHVIDFLAYGNLFIGNLADIFIGVGVAVGVLTYWWNHRARQHSGENAPDATAETRTPAASGGE
ncbi:signal peptidase II [Microbacterium sp. NPDC080220]|uniref:signal peptidase II n=1 Tax=Microbacterium sp. NPDC080220 TaxID=3161017 RepID=UPI003418A42F